MSVRQLLTSLLVILVVGAALMLTVEGKVELSRLAELSAIAMIVSVLVGWARRKNNLHG